MGNLRPVWVDNVSVIAAQTVAFGNVVRGTLDLRLNYGAMLFVRLGRKGTAAPSTSIKVQIRRVINNGGAGGLHPGAVIPLASSTTTGHATTVNVDSAAGQPILNVASVTGFVAGDLVCLYDAAFARLEFARVSKVAASTLVMDAPLGFAHTAAQADNVTRIADVFAPVWLHGGALWEVIVDYGSPSSGADYVCQALAQVYESDTIT